MFELKPLSRAGIPAALEKAERYRLLNEPSDAESIARDVLAADPDHAGARVLLVLALTDQFGESIAGRYDEARELAQRLESESDRCYYTGIVCERRAKAHHRSGKGGGAIAYAWLREAMSWYERAEQHGPRERDNPRLRWNACARLIEAHEDIHPADENGGESMLE